MKYTVFGKTGLHLSQLAQLTSNLGALALGLSAEQLGRLETVSGIGPSALARKPVPWASDERAGGQLPEVTPGRPAAL